MEDSKKVLISPPMFKYHTDPWKTGSIEFKETNCPVCGKHRDYSYVGPFYSIHSSEETEGICPWCIADGSAAKKYDGEFTTTYECEVNNDEYEDELLHRTPGFYSLQESHWMSHCGDFCEFIGKIGQVSGVGINQFLENIIPEDIKEVVEVEGVKKEELEKFMEENGYLEGYLFKCLKCGKMRFYIDAD